ncbi:hypothetical protein KKC13_08115 [bacterium]|nr:hypothetical protein [bacterium]MBU1957799.1 hypothetical protein [bacterium]
MKKEEIIGTLKAHYSRDVRKQLVKSILENEKSGDQIAIDQQYKIINQIFSYVLQQSGWRMGQSSQEWDSKPLEIMVEAFPQIKTTLWYNEQNISATKKVTVLVGKEET